MSEGISIGELSLSMDDARNISAPIHSQTSAYDDMDRLASPSLSLGVEALAYQNSIINEFSYLNEASLDLTFRGDFAIDISKIAERDIGSLLENDFIVENTPMAADIQNIIQKFSDLLP